MTIADDPKHNLLLAALPDADLRRWLPLMEWVEMPRGQVLYESTDTDGHVYFPTTAVCSLLHDKGDGGSVRIAVVGHEGLVGMGFAIADESTPSRAIVQCAGRGLRIKRQTVRDDFDRGGAVLRLLLRYSLALAAQMVQTAPCNQSDTLDRRLCRLLLLSLDRLRNDKVVMTRALMAELLGAPGDGVSRCAFQLQDTGLTNNDRRHAS